MKGRFHAGTNVRREFDLSRFRDAVKDTRHWVSYGVVGTVNDAGDVDDTDQNAILIAPGGVMVDVVLYPSEEPVTCRYAGISGGPSVTILAPIHPGDEVLVALPDGELGLPPAIVAILNSRAVPLPLEQDGKPVFRNDRLSVFAQDVPVEVRTASGASVRLETDGTISAVPAANQEVRLGATTGLEAAALGDTLQTFLSVLKTAFNTHEHPVAAAPGTTGPPIQQIDPPTVTSSNVKVKK